MQATGALAFRSIATKIHPQLPLTPRESQQLLSILTNSFKQHLDNSHPVGISTANGALSTSSSTLGVKAPLPQQKAHTSANASTNDHLNSILASPLLSKKPRSASLSKANELLSFREKPSEWLRERIASGNVAVDDVFTCVESMWAAKTSNPDRMMSVSEILGWLNSSGQITEKGLLSVSTKRTTRLLINLLVAEGHRDVVLRWLELDIPGFTQQRAPFIYFASMQAEIQHGAGLQEAMKLALEMSNEGYLSSTRIRKEVAMTITEALEKLAHAVSADVYNAYIYEFNSWPEFPNSKLHSAALLLHHPSSPSPKLGLEYLNSISSSGTKFSEMSSRNRNVQIGFCLKLARSLLAEKDYGNGHNVLRFIQEQCPKEIGSDKQLPRRTPPARTRPSEEEAANLQQLDGLLLG